MPAVALAAIFTAIGGVIVALIGKLPILKHRNVKKDDLPGILLQERKQFAREQETLIQFITSQLSACEQKSAGLINQIGELQKQIFEQQRDIIGLRSELEILKNIKSTQK